MMDNEPFDPPYEYCPRCYANLTLQKGYRNDLPYWICLGCGEMLINPEVDADDNIAWICDGCGKMPNIQPGFREDCGVWKCTECGCENKIDQSELYLSEDEYQAAKRDPYRGLSDEEALRLLHYHNEGTIDDREDIISVRHVFTGKPFLEKQLTVYNRGIYEYLKDHPVSHMPRIIDLFESENCLIVIEEFIAGRTVEELLEKGPLPENDAVSIAKDVCAILDELHNLPTPIIHRDIKPANIIITPENETYLLDMNVAKWYDPDETDDTRHMGTQYYAAPEQAGYGLTASSARSDIYAVGMLLNVMLTGAFPKEKRPDGRLWDIIERCIRLNADDRYTAKELIQELEE
ncbi:MAG: serine/threonine protein kinase [Lachnospiraceae bacterium]|nr:serine/threonine protein kinase [Lachnospiraceae bacterium]